MKLAPAFVLLLTTMLLALTTGDAVNSTSSSGAEQHLDLFFDAVEDEECLQDLDVMIVVDGSSSVTAENFVLVKEWIKHLATGLHIDHGHVQIGMVQYSSYYDKRPLNRQRFIATEITLGEFRSQSEFDAAVDSIPYQDGKKTFTAKAIRKTIEYDFQGRTSRHPEARRIIVLLTDGKAKDSADLPGVIDLAHENHAFIIPIGVGDFNHDELVLLSHNHTDRVFEVDNFDHLDDIVQDVHHKLKAACDCDLRGSVNEECDRCTSQCTCRPNVVGTNCDQCIEGFFGFHNPEGCQACRCQPDGTEPDTECDRVTGRCQCRAGVSGDACDMCDEGHFDYPTCRECECNGFAWECDDNGVCLECSDGRVGDHCETCGPGTYWVPSEETCLPCPCGGFIDYDDPRSCDPHTGECLKCLDNRTGPRCEECDDYYYNSSGQCSDCGCNEEGVERTECNFFGMCQCDKEHGWCRCAPNVIGDKCDTCAPGYTNMEAGVGCSPCQCDAIGTREQTLCDPETGECECKKDHRGRQCRECALGYARDDLQSPCMKIVPPTTAPATPAELKQATRAPAKTLPVNPGWSPCVNCGGGGGSSASSSSWPSYCRGWTCRTRWPYYNPYQYHHQRRCSPYNYACRYNVERTYSSYGGGGGGVSSFDLYRPSASRYVAPSSSRRRSASSSSSSASRRYPSSSRYGLYRRLRRHY